MYNKNDSVSVTINHGGSTKTYTGDFSVNVVMKQVGSGHVSQNCIVGTHDISGALMMILQLRTMEKEIKDSLPLSNEYIDHFLKDCSAKIGLGVSESKPDPIEAQMSGFFEFLKEILGD